MIRKLSLLLSLLPLGCATYSYNGLAPGKATIDEVMGVMGAPSLQWDLPDGAVQLAYPRGPIGVHTYMVHLDSGKRLVRVENVLTPRVFASIVQGMDTEAVLRSLGPPVPHWTVYFERRDELVWEWRYCDEWRQYARFSVLFDGTTGKVRSTLSLTESQIGLCGGRFSTGSCWCAP